MQRYPHIKYLRYLAAFEANTASELMDLTRVGGYPPPSMIDAQEIMDWAADIPLDQELSTESEIYYSAEGMEVLDATGATLFITDSKTYRGAQKINRSARAREVIQVVAVSG